MGAEARLKELGLELPPIPKPGGIYKPVVVTGKLVYVSGHGPLKSDGTMMTGRVGADVDLAGGQAAAKQTALALLASVRHEIGDLDKIGRVIKTLGMVNCVPDFKDHPAVINGYSQVLKDIYGEDGVGARSAVGMGSLPGNITVEIEVIFELK